MGEEGAADTQADALDIIVLAVASCLQALEQGLARKISQLQISRYDGYLNASGSAKYILFGRISTESSYHT